MICEVCRNQINKNEVAYTTNMYETTVSVEKENNHLLNYVKWQMEQSLIQVDGLMAESQESLRDYFSFACADNYRFQMQRQLRETISQTLALGYKNVYVRKLLKIDKNSFFQNILVNTLCLFDNDYDRQAVRHLIDIEKSIYIDGYYNFRMETLKKKWQEIANLVNDNYYVMTDKTLIVEFLQYLLESSSSKLKKLTVSIEKERFILYGDSDEVMEPTASLAKYSDIEEEVMLNMLWLKPQMIKTYSSHPLSNDFRAMSEQLFDIEYINVP